MKNFLQFSIMEKLSEMPDIDSRINEYILNNIRFTAPGYNTDYSFFTTDSGIEFILGRDFEGNLIGTDIHYSEDYVVTVTIDDILSSDEMSHLYRVKLNDKSDETIPVKVICPDVLAAPTAGNIIDGQAVAFALKNVVLMDSSIYPAGFITGRSSETVIVEGEIIDGYAYEFELFGVSCPFWELMIQTEHGTIPVILAAKGNFEPEIGQYMRTEAILSLDMAIDRETPAEQPLDPTPYLHSCFYQEQLSADGIVPNLRNSEKILMRCIETGNLSAFNRCLADPSLMNRLNSMTDIENPSCSLIHITEHDHSDLVGHSAVLIRSEGEIITLICLDINEYGFVEEINFLSANSCSFSYEPELYALTSIVRALKINRINIIKELLAKKCICHSLTDNRLVIGLSGITYFLETLTEESSDRSELEFKAFEIGFSDHETPIKDLKWKCDLFLREKLLCVLYARLDSRNLVTDIYFSLSEY